MAACRRLTLFALGTLARRSFALSASKLPSKLTLHAYDHCPYCNRVEFLLGKLDVPYTRVLYGYGEGADPAEAGGTGYNPGGGPVVLTGKKILPVLVGEGVPAPAGMKGLPESLEICSYVTACVPGGISPATGRGDLDAWSKDFKEVVTPLVRPRIAKMPIQDWADSRDSEYAVWKYSTKFGFDYDKAVAQTAELLPRASALLLKLEPLLRGTDADGAPCLNSWGLSVDDIILLPDLRQLSCVQGVTWPAKVQAYLDSACGKAQCKSYQPTAVP
mmetsp:Transcript_14540/g.36813  ORF Transcript_14540/g.36813 Transcript_14540/m.36813 type:complete len:274 (-) Transcript_14540:159-980(-)